MQRDRTSQFGWISNDHTSADLEVLMIDDILFDRAGFDLGFVLGFADGEGNIFGVYGSSLEEEVETVLCGISCIESSNASSGIGFNASTDQFFGWEVGVVDVTTNQTTIN